MVQLPGIGRARGSFLAVAIAIAISACGSSGSGSGGGPRPGTGGTLTGEAGAPCDAGFTTGNRDCTLSMPLQGGLTGTLNGEVGCGDESGSSANQFVSWNSSSPNARVYAYFQGGLPMAAGTYPLSSLVIKVTGADGGSQSWTAPTGACTLTVTMADFECQGAFQKIAQVLYGTGTCSQPAEPDSGNTASPITIGDFQFEHWL